MEDLRGNVALPDTHAESGLRVVSHLEFLHRTNMINISGIVAGQEYTAAWTLGDGACALHAVFGVPAIATGRIACAEVRSLLGEVLPKCLSDLVASPQAYLYDLAASLLNNVWCDFIAPAARSFVEKTNPVLPREAWLCWEALPSGKQADLKEILLATLAVEREIDSVYSQLFVEAKEKHLVRRLAVRLGYLTTETKDFLLHNANDMEGIEFEGLGCSLELLHATAENGSTTKYRALFREEDDFGIYRRVFFCNDDLDQELLLRIVKDFGEELAAESYEEDARLMREVCRLLRQRMQCVGPTHMPACLSEEVIWSCFRSALMKDEYWLSIQEIQFISAYFGARLHVYMCDEESLELAELVEESVPSCIANHVYDDSVSLVLQLSGGFSCRGHFSRFLSSDDWDAHLDAVAAREDLKTTMRTMTVSNLMLLHLAKAILILGATVGLTTKRKRHRKLMPETLGPRENAATKRAQTRLRPRRALFLIAMNSVT